MLARIACEFYPFLLYFSLQIWCFVHKASLPWSQIKACSFVFVQVITRTSGVSLGFIRHLCTDPDTLTIVSADLRPKNLSWGITSSENLLLETFCQIGDVVLVHDEGALDFVPQDETLGFIDLIGCPVISSTGDQLGKVWHFFQQVRPSVTHPWMHESFQ